MPSPPRHIAGLERWRTCARRCISVQCVWLVLCGLARAGDVRGTFLPASDGPALWRRTLDTVAADWPVASVVEPDPHATPPRAGLIESGWVEPPGAQTAAWPPHRQRMVVRVVPVATGAWIDAVTETQSISLADDDDGNVEQAALWTAAAEPSSLAPELVARLVPDVEPVAALAPLDGPSILEVDATAPPWADARFPRLARGGYRVVEDYRNFYSCENLVCLSAALGAGAIMANTGFDTTMQNAWQRGVTPTGLGRFFSGCKDLGEGRYTIPIFGAAAATGLVFEGSPLGDVVGEWGSRSLRMFVVGAPPLYTLQWATGASRPNETSAGSDWKPFTDYNGISGHAFVGAIPFLAAADMVESPLLKGTLYVCSTFVGFSRMTDDAHYPSQVFLGWYLAWASARAVDLTQARFAGMELTVVPLPIGDLGGIGVEARW